MKLLRMVTNEAQGPVPVGMTLDEIIRDGKVSNHYQTFVLAWLSEFFKSGHKSASLQLENPIDFESKATSTEVISSLKELLPNEAVALAGYLKDCIAAGESALKDPHAKTVEWIRYVLMRQE